jgi:hypothetical protein
MGEKRTAYSLLVRKPEGKRLLGKQRYKLVNIIKVNLVQIRWSGVDWIDLAQDREKWRALVNAVMNFRVP